MIGRVTKSYKNNETHVKILARHMSKMVVGITAAILDVLITTPPPSAFAILIPIL